MLVESIFVLSPLYAVVLPGQHEQCVALRRLNTLRYSHTVEKTERRTRGVDVGSGVHVHDIIKQVIEFPLVVTHRVLCLPTQAGVSKTVQVESRLRPCSPIPHPGIRGDYPPAFPPRVLHQPCHGQWREGVIDRVQIGRGEQYDVWPESCNRVDDVVDRTI
ncbi:MAG: hypothetical protein DWQ08_15680 [Proteobacteria bacterium]|nr:MAG: hypothetical protein DWQ08_15680 [Pseudomonadota bacterium]